MNCPVRFPFTDLSSFNFVHACHFQNCHFLFFLFRNVLFPMGPFQNAVCRLFLFSELSFFRLFPFRLDRLQPVPLQNCPFQIRYVSDFIFRNCHFPNVSFSDLSFFRISFPGLSFPHSHFSKTVLVRICPCQSFFLRVFVFQSPGVPQTRFVNNGFAICTFCIVVSAWLSQVRWDTFVTDAGPFAFTVSVLFVVVAVVDLSDATTVGVTYGCSCSSGCGFFVGGLHNTATNN